MAEQSYNILIIILFTNNLHENPNQKTKITEKNILLVVSVEEVNGGDVLVINLVVVKEGLNVFVEPGLVVSTQNVQLARVAALVHEDAAHDNAWKQNEKVINLKQTSNWNFFCSINIKIF